MDLFLHGMGHFHPPTIVDNAFLEALDIGTSDAWIVERVGVRERRTVLSLDYIRHTRNRDPRAAEEAMSHSQVEMAARAATLALARAQISAKDVGLVVAGGCCPAMHIPSDAALIAEALDIGCAAFDLNAACASFGAQLHVLSCMAGNGADFALVVNSEANTRVVDYSDRSSAVLWGDGASAAVVSGRVRSRVRVGQTGIGGDARGARTVTIPRFGHFAQQGSLVQRFAIKTMRASLNRSLAGFRARTPEPTGRTRFVGHQANGVALEHVYKSAGLAEDEHWQNVGHFGNTGASGAPCVLSQHWDDLGAGDFIPMVVVGSGLAWAWLELEVQ